MTEEFKPSGLSEDEEELIRLARAFHQDSIDEDWFYLANAEYIETSKTIMSSLLAMLQIYHPVADMVTAEEPPEDVIVTVTGNYVGRKIQLPGMGAGVITDIMEPKDSSEVERIRVKFKDGHTAEFGFKSIVPQNNAPDGKAILH